MLDQAKQERDAAETKWLNNSDEQRRSAYFQRHLDNAERSVTNTQYKVNKFLLAAASNGSSKDESGWLRVEDVDNCAAELLTAHRAATELEELGDDLTPRYCELLQQCRAPRRRCLPRTQHSTPVDEVFRLH